MDYMQPAVLRKAAKFNRSLTQIKPLYSGLHKENTKYICIFLIFLAFILLIVS